MTGFLTGKQFTGWLHIDATSSDIEAFYQIALFTILFTDGMQISRRDLSEGWRLSSRALLIGLPLTMAATAALAHWLTQLNWTEAFLVGAALSPTDPIFAAAIVGRREVSARVRRLLNVESGFNDGLALPAVMMLLGAIGARSEDFATIIEELFLGVGIGIAAPLLVTAALKSRFFAAAGVYNRLGAISIALLVFALTSMLNANEFLAAFTAGVMVSIYSDQMRDAFYDFGETLGELVKLAAIMIFGSLLTMSFFTSFSGLAYLFAALVIFVVRPLALRPLLAGMKLNRRERMAILWFGPKGFASLLFGFIILHAGVNKSHEMFGLIGLAVVFSILAHSSTDVVVARSFHPTAQGGKQPMDRRAG